MRADPDVERAWAAPRSAPRQPSRPRRRVRSPTRRERRARRSERARAARTISAGHRGALEQRLGEQLRRRRHRAGDPLAPVAPPARLRRGVEQDGRDVDAGDPVDERVMGLRRAARSGRSGAPRRATAPTAAWAVQRLGEQAAARALELPVAARPRQRGVAHVVGDVEVRVVHPHRAALAERHVGQPLAVAGDEVQPVRSRRRAPRTAARPSKQRSPRRACERRSRSRCRNEASSPVRRSGLATARLSSVGAPPNLVQMCKLCDWVSISQDLHDPDTFARAYAEHSRSDRAAYGSSVTPPAPRTSCRTSSRPVGGPKFDASRGELGPYLRLMARTRALDIGARARPPGRAGSPQLDVALDEGRRRRAPGRVAVRESRAPHACATPCASSRRPARGARARLLGRADRRRDRPAHQRRWARPRAASAWAWRACASTSSRAPRELEPSLACGGAVPATRAIR